MKRVLNAAVILLTVLLSASLPVSAEQSQAGVNAAASTIVVRGKVVDENNEPFAGVAILAKKATNGVITGVDGTFEINVSKDDELEFSFLGYTNLIEKIDGRSFYLVTMRPQTSELEQVTVVAYGKQRKESVIGAISSMNVDKITHSVSKLSNVLAGQMAGVVAVQRSGEPGEGSDFWIRGVSTFGANNRPLVLVDGIERDLNLVDPDDVETFSILKDATATAIYGVRGANGVVLITTRKGKESSKPVISGRVEASLLQPTRMPKMANAKQFMDMYNFAFEDNKGGVFYTEEAKAKYLDGSDPDLYPNINWMDEIYKNVTSSYRGKCKCYRRFQEGTVLCGRLVLPRERYLQPRQRTRIQSVQQLVPFQLQVKSRYKAFPLYDIEYQLVEPVRYQETAEQQLFTLGLCVQDHSDCDS